MAFWTIEEVAEQTGMTVAQVRESRRRKEWPGNLGRMRGRRLMFDADLVAAGPTVAESTNDPLEAILWTTQGIEAKLVDILSELRGSRPTYFTAELLEAIATTYTTTGDEEE